MSTRLLNHCERFQGHIRAAERKTINNAFFVVPFDSRGEQIQLELTAETFMTSRKPIAPFKMEPNTEKEIPDIFPLKHTVSIPKTNFYKEQNAYRNIFIFLKYRNFHHQFNFILAVKPTSNFSHPHTLMLHYSRLDVKNFFETPVTQDQFESRAILKAFAVAASRAQSLYGDDVKVLENPITVQVIQLESKKIQFGIFQLNTLDLNGQDGVKNYWCRKPEMYLYEDCYYNDGRPALVSYNFEVFRLMNVFYSH